MTHLSLTVMAAKLSGQATSLSPFLLASTNRQSAAKQRPQPKVSVVNWQIWWMDWSNPPTQPPSRGQPGYNVASPGSVSPLRWFFISERRQLLGLFLRPSLRFVIRTVGFSLARLAFLFPPNKIVVPFRNQLVGPTNASFTTLFGRQLSLLESAHSPSHEPHSSGRRFNSASGRIHSDWAAHFNVVPEFVQLIRSRDIGPFTHHPPRQISL